jgi:hypothetical protein
MFKGRVVNGHTLWASCCLSEEVVIQGKDKYPTFHIPVLQVLQITEMQSYGLALVLRPTFSSQWLFACEGSLMYMILLLLKFLIQFPTVYPV